ncbi:hypothetical protein [Methylobacterium sp. J-076]|uniref:hypothetical protein n=1 Tax=Methylobacterium sp. J-076 TaxID=2836655 RepID=UPI001FB99D48|nr:hypothetical protein [Methylobacterium sp. J-076]MCJ2013415.1 hypothetical protein [Methylobacterium sp. J-076]
MDAAQHAVCVALNDDDRAWYEMLIPFILSLRQSDYRGHVVVIGFGLSQRKIDILRGHSVNVVEATEKSLPVARFVEVAKLCDLNPGLTKIALYDADIWFCSETFDLFSHVEGDDIFVCKDAYLCDFVSDPLIGSHREANVRRVAEDVLERYGGALQAGLVAGTAAAWKGFAAHIRRCLDGVGTDFRLIYGIDTCFLHLWGAEGRVRLLPETQNFVTKNGLVEWRTQANRPILRSAAGPVRGLHMTGDIRFLNCWRYFSIHADRALDAGRPFALSDSAVSPVTAVPPGLAGTVEEAGLEIVSLAGEDGAGLHAFRDGDGLTIVGTGNHDITLRTTRAFDPLACTVMYLSGHPAPLKMRIAMAGQEIGIGRDLSQWASMTMPPGVQIDLHAESLPGQMCKVVWILSDRRSLAQ